MQATLKEARYFFYSQAFADGLRATVAILFPALVASYFGRLDLGLTISLGAMVVSLTDAPGPLLHKRNGMFTATALATVVAILTGLVQANVYTLGLLVILASFLLSMFTVFGPRATSVGNAALLVIILNMDGPTEDRSPLLQGLLVAMGGSFYLTLSLLLYAIRPYRYAQRILGECIREIADYLSIRADFYNHNVNLNANYRRLIAQQVVVNEKQDAVREVFFKTRRIVEESTDEGRKLVYSFVETVDLFEDITASYYDYNLLRERFGGSGALELIYASLQKITGELNAVGIAIETAGWFRKGFDYDAEVRSLKSAVDALTGFAEPDKLVLKRLIVNIRNLYADLVNIEQYFEKIFDRKPTRQQHSHFVSHQPVSWAVMQDNLTLSSSSFRHAVRVTAASALGYVLINVFSYGTHSYWVLLTIAFILKPAFSLTKERNVQRILGTVAGAVVGVAVLYFVDNRTALFVIMAVLMIGTYSFMRINYLAMVICTTPYVFILLTFLGTPFQQVAKERILDTVIGCAIAFSAAYFLFPKWEREDLKTFMQKMMEANAGYLRKLIEALQGKKVSTLEYKLARRNVYLHSANLSALFQRMLSEPKSQQRSESKVQQFVVLNHILYSNIATVATNLLESEPKTYPEELVQMAKKSERRLLADEQKQPRTTTLPLQEIATPTDGLLKEQLGFIDTVAKDIEKLAKTIG